MTVSIRREYAKFQFNRHPDRFRPSHFVIGPIVELLNPPTNFLKTMSKTKAAPTPAAAPVTDKPVKHFAIGMLILAVLLLFSFRDGLAPNMAQFSNDAPLGLIKAQEEVAWQNLQGVWQPLNWVGMEQPSGQPTIDSFWFMLVGPEMFAKSIAFVSLCFLGLAAWLLFRALGFHPVVCIAGILAASFNTNAFSNACWGLSPWVLARGMVILALAALVSYHKRPHWSKLVLAGFATGFNVMEGFDTGAIYSLYIAAFGFLLAVNRPSAPVGKRVISGGIQVAVIAICAFLMASHVVSNLIGTQIQGVAGMKQDEKSREQRYLEATRWSLPPAETLRVIVPGLWGYRMDTPDGGQYWGTVGAADGVPQSRYSGSGEYAGILVAIMALWALGQSFSKSGPETGGKDRGIIWFWGIAAFISLLLAFGRFTPFYKLIYALPYFSTIRNPIKFMSPFQISVLILFGYGLNHLVTNFLANQSTESRKWKEAWVAFRQLKDKHSRMLVHGLVALAGLGMLATMIYSSSMNELVNYLQKTGFAPELAEKVAGFSVTEAFTAVIFFAACILLIWGSISGWLRAKVAMGLLLALLAVDMVRANAPWVIFYDYTYRYASNQVIDFLKENNPPSRVAAEVAPMTRSYLLSKEASFAGGIFNSWLQQLFQYYRIQSLDITQMPRVPEQENNYFQAFRPTGNDQYKVARLWELTSTRYLLGQAGFEQALNQQFDPAKKRFTLKQAFQFQPKPGVTKPGSADDITAQFSDNGPFAIFEFSGALPRAKLYTHWQSKMADADVLSQLQRPEFSPADTVLISDDIPAPKENAAAGDAAANQVEKTTFDIRRVAVKVKAAAPSILLLNDRYSTSWKVFVDGQEKPLLRANYLMRGVQINPGDQEVVFKFQSPSKFLPVTFASIIAALGLIAWWGFFLRKKEIEPVKS